MFLRGYFRPWAALEHSRRSPGLRPTGARTAVNVVVLCCEQCQVVSCLFLRFREFVVGHLCDGLLGTLWAPLADSLCRLFLSAAAGLVNLNRRASARRARCTAAVGSARRARCTAAAVRGGRARAARALRRFEFLLEVSALGVIECVEFLLRVRFGVEKAPRLGRVGLPAALLPVVLLVSEDVRFLLSPIQLLPRL